MFLIPIVDFVLMLTFLVVIHELGHFITARRFKVKIEEFGIGYPPFARKLFTWRGIPFTLNWIPVGGFVRMLGEDESNNADTASQLSNNDPQKEYAAFYTKPRWQRLIIVLAGASVNFLFGVLAFTIIYAHMGIPTRVAPPKTVIMEVAEGPGKQAGLSQGDQILAVHEDKGEVFTVGDPILVTEWIRARADRDIFFTLGREGKTRDVKVHTRKKSEIATQGAIGVTLGEPGEPIVFKFYPWYQMPFYSAKEGLVRSLQFSKLILDALGKMGYDLFKHGKVPADVAGPIGIVHEVSRQNIFGGDFYHILDFTAMFSINLAVMNVLPIPALDGGRALLILLELLVGRRRIARVEQHANAIGIALLLLLIAVVSLKDIWMLQ